jgi:hypothetical protein
MRPLRPGRRIALPVVASAAVALAMFVIPSAQGATVTNVLASAEVSTPIQGALTEDSGTGIQPNFAPNFRHDRLSRSRASAAVQAYGVWGGDFTTTSGEHITMLDSSYYAENANNRQALQSWANWMSSYLFHSQEFSKLTVLLVAPFELPYYCGAGAGGCYSAERALIIAPGNHLPNGTNMATILAHEYGHHVAANASNPPMNALDWGPKRWASGANVCARVKAGTAFPGDEGSRYALNPGEAFAETYRLAVYNSYIWTNGWWNPAPWNSDQSFFPNSTGLDAARQDALHPWVATLSPQTTLTGKFTKKRRQFTTDIYPRLDGDISVTLYRPIGGRLTLIDGSSGAILATASASFTFADCGQRSLRLRVAGRAGQGFRVDVTTP